MAKKNSPDYTKIITQLTDRTGQVVFAFDVKENTFLYLNPSFETMWNRGKESILKNPLLLLDTLHPEEKQFMEKSFQDLRSGQSIKDVEFRILWPDKTERWLCLTPFQLAISCILKDILIHPGLDPNATSYSIIPSVRLTSFNTASVFERRMLG